MLTFGNTYIEIATIVVNSMYFYGLYTGLIAFNFLFFIVAVSIIYCTFSLYKKFSAKYLK